MTKKKPKAVSSVKSRARRVAPLRTKAKELTAKPPLKRSAPKRVEKGYDAEKYTGAIPGLAERMKDYLEHMRDDR